MALTDILAVDRETLLFAKKETTFGTGVKPAASDQVLIAGEGTIKQELGFITDAQKRNTFSMLSRIAGRFEPGDVSLPIYIKPSGTLGTKPEGAQLYEALFGREVVTGGTKVEYFLLRITDTRPSLTFWFKQGHFVYMAWGCVLNQATFPIKAGNSDDAVAQVNLTAFFAELRWTGTDEANETISVAQSTLLVKDASKYSVGSYIIVGGDDNGGVGFEVTAVNIATNTLTLSPDINNVTTNDQIDPWLPAGTELGDPVHGRLGIATRGGVNLPLLSSEITIDNKIKMLNEEKNGLNFANRFIHANAREINVNSEIYFDADAAKFFSESSRSIQADVVVPIGDTAGKRVTLTVKNVELNSPEVTGGEEKVMRINGVAFASSSFDDELVMLFD